MTEVSTEIKKDIACNLLKAMHEYRECARSWRELAIDLLSNAITTPEGRKAIGKACEAKKLELGELEARMFNDFGFRIDTLEKDADAFGTVIMTTDAGSTPIWAYKID
jgi:hypothetical protein